MDNFAIAALNLLCRTTGLILESSSTEFDGREYGTDGYVRKLNPQIKDYYSSRLNIQLKSHLISSKKVSVNPNNIVISSYDSKVIEDRLQSRIQEVNFEPKILVCGLFHGSITQDNILDAVMISQDQINLLLSLYYYIPKVGSSKTVVTLTEHNILTPCKLNELFERTLKWHPKNEGERFYDVY